MCGLPGPWTGALEDGLPPSSGSAGGVGVLVVAEPEGAAEASDGADSLRGDDAPRSGAEEAEAPKVMPDDGGLRFHVVPSTQAFWKYQHLTRSRRNLGRCGSFCRFLANASPWPSPNKTLRRLNCV